MSTIASTVRGAPTAGWVRDDRYNGMISAMITVLVLLMILPEGLDYSSLSGSGAPASGDLFSRLLWFGLLGGGLLVLAIRHALAAHLLRRLNIGLVAFAVLAAASALWSVDPGFTLRRLIRIATFTIDALALALVGWHAQRLQQVLRPVITAVLAGSIVFGILRPDLAIHQETSHELLHAWRGLTNHKNSLGALAALGLLLWWHAGLSREASRVAAFAGCAVSLACLLLSRSSTSLMAGLFAVVLLTLMLRPLGGMRPYLPWMVGAFAASLTLYTLMSLNVLPGKNLMLGPMAALAGKDTSMTGRAVIWDLISQHIDAHPLLGTGYGAYWTGPVPQSQSYEFVQKMHFYPGSAHNGYLEVANDLGIVGVLCLCLYLFTYLRQSLRLLPLMPAKSALYLAVFLQEAVINLSESHWFSVMSVNFLVMTLATVGLARDLFDQSLMQRQPTAGLQPGAIRRG